ncbi:MAG: DegQ family serine endoprotease [Rhodospirillaceae bacterium]|nr:DegQ family serine endoprotease [Rhodospirillaceae bacterium]
MSALVTHYSARLLTTAAVVAALAGASVMVPGYSQAQIPNAPMRDGIPTLAPLIERAVPAVVNVSVKQDMSNNPLFNDPMFRKFFDVPERMPKRERQSAGSGVIVDAKKGYVLTNHHVVDDATEITVRLKDNREFVAKKIGSDEATDVALLQIDAKDLVDLPIGDSGKLQVGDFAVAIGNPFGLGQTVTSGIVSALGRSGLNIEGYEDFIQTDAAINPGNSGGPLINLKGEMVGMNTAIMGSSGGGNVGIGFAVPTSIISNVMGQLIEHGEVRRGRIGIVIADLSPELSKSLNVSQNEGAVIQRVEKGSPGDKAGLKAGDVAITLNGKSVKSSADLRNRVGLSQVGSTVDLVIIRDGAKKEVKVTLEKVPEKQEVAAIEEREALEGASFSNPESGDGNKGVIVKQVQRGSAAYQAGLRERDVVAAVNRKPVKTVNEFEKALKEGGRQVALSVKRGEEDLFLIIQ